MSEPLTLRLAEPQDAAVVAELVDLLARELNESSSVTPAHAADLIRRGAIQVLLASRDGRVVGLASFHWHEGMYHAGQSCLLDELIVRPEARHQRIGARLLEEVVRRAREAGCVEISLSVMRDNTEALRFYQRHGFEADALLLERHFPEG